MAKKDFSGNVALGWLGKDINIVSGNGASSSNDKETISKPLEKKDVTKQPVAEDSFEKPEPKQKNMRNGVKIVLTKEKKTRRVCFRLKSDTYEKIENLAKENSITLSNCINQILDQVVQ